MHPVVPIGVRGRGADEAQDVLQRRSVEFLRWSQASLLALTGLVEQLRVSLARVHEKLWIA